MFDEMKLQACIVNSSHLCCQIDMQVNNVKSHNDLAHLSIVGCFSYSAREFVNQKWYIQRNKRILFKGEDVDHKEDHIERKQEDGGHYCTEMIKNHESTLYVRTCHIASVLSTINNLFIAIYGLDPLRYNLKKGLVLALVDISLYMGLYIVVTELTLSIVTQNMQKNFTNLGQTLTFISQLSHEWQC